jgi:hypothetical protein
MGARTVYEPSDKRSAKTRESSSEMTPISVEESGSDPGIASSRRGKPVDNRFLVEESN